MVLILLLGGMCWRSAWELLGAMTPWRLVYLFVRLFVRLCLDGGDGAYCLDVTLRNVEAIVDGFRLLLVRLVPGVGYLDAYCMCLEAVCFV